MHRMGEFMVDLRLLEQLDAFARAGSLSGASRELHVSQPALSRAMRRLEAELGAPLFERSSSRIALNATGRLAAELAVGLLGEASELERRVREHDRASRGVALACCAAWPAIELDHLLRMRYGHQSVEAEVVAGDDELAEGLLARRWQVAVTRAPVEHPDVLCEPIARESLTLSVPEGHRLASLGSLTFSDLDGETILALSTGGFWDGVVEEACAGATLLFQRDVDDLGELVARTSLPTFSSDRMAVSGYAEPGRVDVPFSDARAVATYHACVLCDEAHGRLAGLMADLAGRSAGWGLPT